MTAKKPRPRTPSSRHPAGRKTGTPAGPGPGVRKRSPAVAERTRVALEMLEKQAETSDVDIVGRIFDVPLLDEVEAARILNLSATTLKKWRRLDRGPRYYRLGTAVRYSREDLEEYAERSAKNPRKTGHEDKGGG